MCSVATICFALVVWSPACFLDDLWGIPVPVTPVTPVAPVIVSAAAPTPDRLSIDSHDIFHTSVIYGSCDDLPSHTTDDFNLLFTFCGFVSCSNLLVVSSCILIQSPGGIRRLIIARSLTIARDKAKRTKTFFHTYSFYVGCVLLNAIHIAYNLATFVDVAMTSLSLDGFYLGTLTDSRSIHDGYTLFLFLSTSSVFGDEVTARACDPGIVVATSIFSMLPFTWRFDLDEESFGDDEAAMDGHKAGVDVDISECTSQDNYSESNEQHATGDLAGKKDPAPMMKYGLNYRTC
jgi:hypothetical protein